MSCPGDNYVVPGANPCSGGGGGGGGGSVNSVSAGTNAFISGTSTDPIVNATGVVQTVSVDVGSGLTITGSATNPSIGTNGVVRNVFGTTGDIGVGGVYPNPVVGLIGNFVRSVNAGTSITVDNSDPKNPVINATGAAAGVSAVNSLSGSLTLNSVLGPDGIDIANNPPGTIQISKSRTPSGQFYKTVIQNVASGESLVTFNLPRTWNTAGYIQDTTTSLFTCAFKGVYHIVYNLSVINSNAVWSNQVKTATILQTRSGAGSGRTFARTSAVNGSSYEIQVSAVLELFVGDTLQFLTDGLLSSGFVTVAFLSGIDFNTTFSWTLIKPS
jgi:hypothetical protein